MSPKNAPKQMLLFGLLSQACGRALTPGSAGRRVPNPEIDGWGDAGDPGTYPYPLLCPRTLSCQAWFGLVGGARVLHSATHQLQGMDTQVVVTAHMCVPKALEVRHAMKGCFDILRDEAKPCSALLEGKWRAGGLHCASGNAVQQHPWPAPVWFPES